ncbi:sodium-dependent transporter [Methanococcoides sp. FTZ1]|uniref:sodium-dependent transporter n=1 Tax=Methanococcoides sp. FTZ1 TaxID=3439061 RepID=UPI003F82947F
MTEEIADTNREQLATRMGFLLVSAGCAIGLGNIWRFPFIAGKYGGAAFVLFYLAFLLILGLPILIMEFATGRAGRRNIAGSLRNLEPNGKRWHLFGYIAIIGNVILLMFYTTVAGWGFAYFYYMVEGSFIYLDPSEIGVFFDLFMGRTMEMITWMALVVGIGTFICSVGLQKGVERAGKVMMSGLFFILIILVLRSVTLPGAAEGISFYLEPDFSSLSWEGIYAAMTQAFFTLSVGVGGMTIFGSYINRDHSLTGESLKITFFDTAIALMAGLMIFPACSAFGVDVGSGPGLLFVTLPNVFNQMPAGVLWGTLFFLFLAFASMSTVMGITENVIAFTMDEWGWKRRKASIMSGVAIFVLSIPCCLGFGPLSWFKPFGEGTSILDLEDFIFTNNILPIGALTLVLFCSYSFGWGWNNFIQETDHGKGIKFPKQAKPYIKYILPLIIIFILVRGWIGTLS